MTRLSLPLPRLALATCASPVRLPAELSAWTAMLIFSSRYDPGRTLMDLAGLEIQLEQLLSREVDVVTEQGLPDSVRATALGEAVRV